MLPPPVDPRTQAEVAAQTERWAEAFTALSVPPTVEALTGRVLDEAVINPATGKSIASRHQWLDAALAAEISGTAGVEAVRVKGWLAPGTVVQVPPLAEALVGKVLAQPTLTDARGSLLATRGELISHSAAEAASYGSTSVLVTLPMDAGAALIRLFSSYAYAVTERLNLAPDKHFLAFLDMLGVSLRPPYPARVPLTFALAASSPVDALVTAGTQVAATDATTGEEIVFETERDLLANRATLTALATLDPLTDRYCDHSALIQPGLGFVTEQGISPFTGEEPLPHALYLAADGLMNLQGLQQLTLSIYSPELAALMALPIVWERWDGVAAWQAVPVGAQAPTSSGAPWQLTFAPAALPLASTANGLTARWLRGRLATALPAGTLTVLDAATAQYQLAYPALPPRIVVRQTPYDASKPFYPFGDNAPLAQYFYLDAGESLAQAGATVTLDVTMDVPGVTTSNLCLTWAARVNGKWVDLGSAGPGCPATASAYAFSDGTAAFTKSGQVRFQVPTGWNPDTMYGHEGYWIRVALTGSYATPPRVQTLRVGYAWKLPRIERISARATVGRSGLQPDIGFFNLQQLDLSKDFYPLGEQPRFNDTLALAAAEVLGRAGTTVTLTVTLRNPNTTPATGSPVTTVATTGNPVLAWEVWNGQSWIEVGRSSTSADSPSPNPYQFRDTTRALTRHGSGTSGQVSFTLPATVGQTTVNGEESYWLRARLVSGNYGSDATYSQVKNQSGQLVYTSEGVPVYQLVPATFAPPVIASLQVAYAYQPPDATPTTLTHNSFTWADVTALAADTGGFFAPFLPSAEQYPALYLGFSPRLPNSPVTLYVEAEAPIRPPKETERPAVPPQVPWEYLAADGWRPLGVFDESQNFTRPGLLQFLGPADAIAADRLGYTNLFWLRAGWQAGEFMSPAHLHRLVTNTTWASQVATIREETLGPSNGEPGQRFRTRQSPVLPGQQLEVREPRIPSAEEQARLAQQAEPDGVRVVADESGQVQEVWVRWHEVPAFHASGPDDRHYMLDHLTGEVLFGNGRLGMIPPMGQNAIRMARYRIGGGTRGNQPAQSVVQLKTTVPYVDSVTNHEAALGGTEQEALASARERGPRWLRHRTRAVTWEDFADLAEEAAPTEVSRVLVVTPIFDPLATLSGAATSAPAEHVGVVGLLLVPQSNAARPALTLELAERVREYVQARSSPTLDLWVSEPGWVEVSVQAEVASVTLEQADQVRTAILAALAQFLHPLMGGRTGQGWPFNQLPHPSDFYGLIEGLPGVDHVHTLALTLAEPIGEAGTLAPITTPSAPHYLVYSGTHSVTMLL